MVGQLARLKRQGLGRARSLDQRTRGWLGVLAGAAQATLRPETGIIAAAIAYYALFSLFPLTLLSVAIASFSLGPAMDQQLVVRQLEFIAPALGQLLGENIDQIIRARGPITGAALLGLIWAASAVFYTLSLTLNEMWGIKRRRSGWKRRGLALLFVLAVVGPALFLTSLGGSLLANLRPWLPDSVTALAGGVGLALAIVLDIASFMLLYTLLPHGAAGWREILPGAIAAGLLWELAKKAFLLFVAAYISVSNLIYGSVAAIMAFLLWAYFSGLIFLFGAFISVAYHRLKQQRQAAADPRP